jgi:hypothetical protein
MIIFFQIFFKKLIIFLKFENIAFSMSYYDDFQHVNFIFSQKFISLFWGLFNEETDLRVI